MRRTALIGLGVALCLAAAAPRTVVTAADMPAGKVDLVSAGRLAFGPDGVLFVADSVGGQIVAIDTMDKTAAKAPVKIDVQGVDAKIAALVGIAPDQIMINDVKVNPASKNVYLSAARGRGPDSMPL